MHQRDRKSVLSGNTEEVQRKHKENAEAYDPVVDPTNTKLAFVDAARAEVPKTLSGFTGELLASTCESSSGIPFQSMRLGAAYHEEVSARPRCTCRMSP